MPEYSDAYIILSKTRTMLVFAGELINRIEDFSSSSLDLGFRKFFRLDSEKICGAPGDADKMGPYEKEFLRAVSNNEEVVVITEATLSPLVDRNLQLMKQDGEKHGFRLTNVATNPHFAGFDIGTQIIVTFQRDRTGIAQSKQTSENEKAATDHVNWGIEAFEHALRYEEQGAKSMALTMYQQAMIEDLLLLLELYFKTTKLKGVVSARFADTTFESIRSKGKQIKALIEGKEESFEERMKRLRQQGLIP